MSGQGDVRRGQAQLTISLLGVRPSVWRRILVPEPISFWDLHVALQDAMGWEHRHLHEFRLAPGPGGEPRVFGVPDEDSGDTTVQPGWAHAVREHVGIGESLEYIYDFGDDWRHRVVLDAVLPATPGGDELRCIDGECACPPEDCGGPRGYRALLDALADPATPEHAILRDALPRGWQPALFDPGSVRFSDPAKRWRHAFLD